MTSTTQNNGLSAGAIAGIVIGVIAAILIILLLLACFCFRRAADGILSFFGLRNRRRREETTYIEERHSHRASGSGGRIWPGAGPSRVEREKKKRSGIGGLGYVLGGLGGLAILLGLKRKRDEKKKTKSEYGSSEASYSYESYTSPSESIIP